MDTQELQRKQWRKEKMVLYDSGLESIYKQMSAERDRVKYYDDKFTSKALSSWKHKRPPCLYYQIQQFPESRNTYLHYYYALKEAEVRDGCCFFGNLLLLNDDDGKQIAIRLMTVRERNFLTETDKIDCLQIFTGHFFSRYRERFSFTKDLSTTELIATFAGRNLGYMHKLNYNDIVLKKNREKNGSAYQIEDGVMLGTTEYITIDGKKVMVVTNKTFLNMANLKDDQEEKTTTRDFMHELLTWHFK